MITFIVRSLRERLRDAARRYEDGYAEGYVVGYEDHAEMCVDSAERECDPWDLPDMRNET